jgi:hypothetical protein
MDTISGAIATATETFGKIAAMWWSMSIVHVLKELRLKRLALRGCARCRCGLGSMCVLIHGA